MALSDFGRRAIGAARLDGAIYAEVEHDTGATAQALAIVLLAAAGAAVGRGGPFHATALGMGLIVSLVGWAVWATVCVIVGARLVPSRRTEVAAGQRLRVLGFAAAPGILQALGAFAPLHVPVLALAQAGMILAMVVAVRQTFDSRGTSRVLAVCLIGWIAHMAATFALLAALLPLLLPRELEARRTPAAMPTAGYLGVVKPSGIAPPVE
jgi:hypothetical protein